MHLLHLHLHGSRVALAAAQPWGEEEGPLACPSRQSTAQVSTDGRGGFLAAWDARAREPIKPGARQGKGLIGLVVEGIVGLLLVRTGNGPRANGLVQL